MLAQITFPVAHYAATRLHLLRLFALLFCVAVALPIVAMVATAVWPLIVLALPVVGKLVLGGLCIAAFAMATKP